jgi:hypothetical protein
MRHDPPKNLSWCRRWIKSYWGAKRPPQKKIREDSGTKLVPAQKKPGIAGRLVPKEKSRENAEKLRLPLNDRA